MGRREELALLWERWVCVRAGVGQVVLLHGEAGIGKSRLVRAFRDRLRGDEAVWLECRCSPYGRGSALRPVIELLEDLLVFEPEDSAGEKLRKLQEGLARVGLDGQDEVRTIASLLSIALPGVTAVEAKDPRWERDRILEILRDWLFRLGSQRPAVVVVEDAHWADPSSVELSRLLVAQASRAAVLLLLVYRPEFEAGWPIPEQVTSIELTRLAEEDVAKLVTGVAGKRALPRELESEIVARADGVPLFAEELAKAVLEAGPGNAVSALRARNGAPARPAIPSTLHGSLMARFDRLPEARELAQVAAAIGREFPYGLLKSVSKLEDEGLRAKLGQLVDAGLLYQGGEPPSAVYCFKHGLIRDVVYESLIEQERKQIHRQIADELSNHDPETSEARPELIAHHFTLAGLREPAVHHCERAGRRAGERAAYREAIDHLRCGLDLLQVLPETAERVRRELQLQVSLGAAFTAARGLGAPEAERVYERARSLLRRTGDSSPLFPALRSLWAFHNARAELELASDLARQLLELAERDRRAVLLVEAHRARAETRLYQGQLVLAEQELERLRQLYDRRDRAFFASQSAQDPGVTYYAFAALVSWLRGCPRRAFEQSTNAIELAQSLEDPSSLAHALVFGALVHHLRGEWEAALDRAERAVSLAREHRFPLWLAMGEVMQGAARVEGGALEAGLAQLERGFAAYEATGARIGRPVQLGLLAAAYQRAGRLEDSLNAVDTALACVRDTGERMYEAGLLSLRGDLALASAPERWKEGEQYLRTAIRVAQEQDAKSLELQATLSLARLLHEHGRAAEGRGMLSAIQDELSEGPGTADAMAAREFLGEKR